MGKNLFIGVLFSFFALVSLAQEEDRPPDPPEKHQEIDSLKSALEVDGLVVQDSLIVKKRAINPLAPSKAAFYSAIVPGLGQVYNRRYWKVPIVYAALGTGVYIYMFNDNNYDRFRTAFKRRQAGFTDDEFWDYRNPGGDLPAEPDLPTSALEDGQERYQRDRDLTLVVTLLIYALNVVDANVDSHLKQFNVDEDLSLDFRPYLDLDPITNRPSYGLAFAIKF